MATTNANTNIIITTFSCNSCNIISSCKYWCLTPCMHTLCNKCYISRLHRGYETQTCIICGQNSPNNLWFENLFHKRVKESIKLSCN